MVFLVTKFGYILSGKILAGVCGGIYFFFPGNSVGGVQAQQRDRQWCCFIGYKLDSKIPGR